MIHNSDFLRILQSPDLMKDIVLVDLNWVLYKSFFVFPPETFQTSEGKPNGHLFGLVKLLQTLTKLGFLVFLCEDGKCDFRKQLNEHYKEGRTSQGFYKDYNLIHALVNDMKNVYCLSNISMEADDVIFSASMQVPDNTYCYIHSADNDLYQCLIRPNIKISKSITMSKIDMIDKDSTEYTNKYPVEPLKLPFYRALKGDSSDNLLPPVPRIPKSLVVRLCDYFNDNTINASLDNFVIEKPSEQKWIDLLKENIEGFRTNYNMMKLNVIDFSVVPKQNFKYKSFEVASKLGLYQFANFLNPPEIVRLGLDEVFESE